MVRLLIYLKRKMPFLWRIVEHANHLLLGMLYSRKLRKARDSYSDMGERHGLNCRMLAPDDTGRLHAFLSGLDEEEFAFFKPHPFTRRALRKVLGKNLYLPLGVFDGESLAGYFFLRLFFNRKAFIGLIVRPEFQGKGIGTGMIRILLDLSEEIGFVTYSTISLKNEASFKSHDKNGNMSVVKKLDDGYVLVKFEKPK